MANPIALSLSIPFLSLSLYRLHGRSALSLLHCRSPLSLSLSLYSLTLSLSIKISSLALRLQISSIALSLYILPLSHSRSPSLTFPVYSFTLSLVTLNGKSYRSLSLYSIVDQLSLSILSIYTLSLSLSPTLSIYIRS